MTSLRNVLVVTHSDWKGAAHFLAEYLATRVTNLAFLEIPFPYSRVKYSRLSTYFEGNLIRTRESRLKVTRGIPGYLSGVISIWSFMFSYGAPELVIAADGLNTANLHLIRRLRKWGRLVFYSIDYVPRRFDSRLLNRLYHAVDKFALKHADLVWNLSPRMTEGRIERDGRMLSKNEIVVPIGCRPSFAAAARDRRKLIFVGQFTEKQGLQLVLETLPRVVNKVPDVTLDIIGEGPYEETLRRMARSAELDRIVHWVGRVDEAQDLLEKIGRGSVGLAPYRPSPDNFTYFADPTKIKDYLSSGLPIVLTAVPWISTEIKARGAGIVIPYDVEALEAALVTLLTDDSLHDRMSRATQLMALETTWDLVFDAAMKETGRILDIRVE